MMQLIVLEASAEAIKAGYQCSCGCTPSASYVRGDQASADVCCCGNEFALGVDAQDVVHAKQGFRLETVSVEVPWDEPVMAAWMVGPGIHAEGHHDDHDAHAGDHGHHHASSAGDGTAADNAVDPVCGMSVEPAAAREKGLHSHYKGTDYYFCGKGCKLEFDDDPERFLDPAYTPSM